MSTFDGQPALPKLPIPPLEDTCKRYLLAVTPLLTKQELVTTTAAVERFLVTDGPALQRSLCEYAADKSSYIEDFWFDAYLSGSSSVVLNINPYFVLEDDPTPSNNDQVHRAASLTMSALQFVSKLRAGTLAADDWRGTPLCMNQYRKLFGCTRVPHQQARRTHAARTHAASPPARPPRPSAADNPIRTCARTNRRTRSSATPSRATCW